MDDEEEETEMEDSDTEKLGDSHFLEPADKEISDYAIPAILGLAGAALLYKAFYKKKKDDPKETKSKIVPVEDSEVKFTKNYSSYLVGKSWEETVLEPYLADQAEEGNLYTVSGSEGSFYESISSSDSNLINSRKAVLAAFSSTTKVSTPDGDTLIAKLPSKPNVIKFISWLESQIKKFQDEY